LNLPLCLICIKSGILCKSCQSKLDSGEIDHLDIKISKIFLELENKFPELKSSTFYKAIDVNDTVMILVSGKVSKSTWNKVALKIKDKINKNIRIIEKSASIRHLAEQILSPIRVKSVNTIWLPDGSCEIYIKLSKSELSKLRISKEVVENVLSKFTKEVIRIVLE